MDEKKHNSIDPWDDGVYGTGKTMPPKSQSFLVPFLLMAVILLSGIVSALSFLNIRLFRELNAQKEAQDMTPISFSAMEEGTFDAVTAATAARSSEATLGMSAPGLGLVGDQVTLFDQSYFHIPPGLHLTAVEPGSDAARQGIVPGDILMSLDGLPILSQEELEQFTHTRAIGDTVTALFFRGEKQFTLTLTVTEATD